MSAPTVCPRCGAVNAPEAKFCAKCGNPIATIAQPVVPAPSYPSWGAAPQTPPTYNYAGVAAQERTRQIDRTKTGLLLLLIGVLLTPIPYVNFVGDILLLIGAILVIVGRKAFGPTHSRNTIWSIIVFVLGIAVIIAGSVVFAVAVASATISSITNGTPNTTAISQSLSSSFNLLLILAVVGGAILGVAEVLFTYGLQKQTGKILLWTAYAAALAVSIVTFLIISPLITNAASQAFSGTTYNPAAFSNLQSQEQVLELLNFIPAIIYAIAIYMARSRIQNGELPGSASQSIAQPNV